MEKYKGFSGDSEAKYNNSVSELNNLKKIYQELTVKSEKQQTDINEKVENIQEVTEKLLKMKVKW